MDDALTVPVWILEPSIYVVPAYVHPLTAVFAEAAAEFAFCAREAVLLMLFCVELSKSLNDIFPVRFSSSTLIFDASRSSVFIFAASICPPSIVRVLPEAFVMVTPSAATRSVWPSSSFID